MNKDAKVAIKNEDEVMMLDLQDFPHGDLADVRKDDKYDIEFYEVPASMKVPSYNPETGHVEWKQVKYWSVHRGKKIEIVNLQNGCQIYTDDDPRAVYGVASDAETLEPQRFTPSEALSRKVMVPVSNSELPECGHNGNYDFETGTVSNEVHEHSVPVDFDFGQFVGLMAGDGWSTCKYVRIADNEGFNIGFVTEFMKKVYPDFYTKEYVQTKDMDLSRYGDTKCYSLNTGHTYFYDRIKELVDGHGDEKTSGSANKRLPEWFQFAGKDFIHGLVCGMIATDGTVAVSHGKDKPQLRIQYTSTSLRLVREFQRCCHIIGVRCTVAFSKKTSGGNEAWNCTVSTVDAKKADLLCKCCHARKRQIFMETDVETGDKYVKNDILPFPRSLSSEIVSLIPAIKNPKTEEDKVQQSLCMGVRKYAEQGSAPRALFKRVLELGSRIALENINACDAGDSVFSTIVDMLEHKVSENGKKSAKFVCAEVSREETDVLRKAVEARKSGSRDNSQASEMLKMLYLVRKTGKMYYAQMAKLRDLFDQVPQNSDLLESAALSKMIKIADSGVEWTMVESVEKTGQEVLGYDLTVPGYDTFVNADGVILSNTVNIHVPASEKASREALEKMLPSKNLFSLTDMKSVRYKPEKEQVSGLWALTSGMTNKKTQIFKTKAEAIQAYRNGEIGPNDPVEILK